MDRNKSQSVVGGRTTSALSTRLRSSRPVGVSLGLFAIAGWSFHASLFRYIVEITSISTTTTVYFSAALYASVFTAILLAFLILSKSRHIYHVLQLKIEPIPEANDFEETPNSISKGILYTENIFTPAIILPILSGIALGLSYAFYYAGMELAEPIGATVLNYLFPITVIVVSTTLLTGVYRRPEPHEWILISVAVLGSTAVFFSAGQFSLSEMWAKGYTLAFISGILGGIHPAIGAICQQHLKKRGFDEIMAYAIVLFWIFVGCCFGISGLIPFSDVIFPKRYEFWLAILVMALIPYTLAEFGWLASLNVYKATSIVSISYLSPILSLAFLSLFFGQPIYPLAVFGLLAILIPNIILHSDGAFDKSSNYTLVFSLSMAYMIYVTHGINLARLPLELASIIAGIFAIIVSFYLARIGEKNRLEQHARAKIFSEIVTLYEGIHDATKKKGAASFVEAIGLEFVILETKGDKQTRHGYEMYRRTENLLAQLCQICDRGESEVSGMKLNSYHRVRAALDEFVDLKASRLSRAEVFFVWFIGTGLVGSVFLSLRGTMEGDLTAIAVSSAVVFLIITVYENNRNRPRNSLTDFTDLVRLYERVGATPVVPGNLPWTEYQKLEKVVSGLRLWRDRSRKIEEYVSSTIYGRVILGRVILAILALMAVVMLVVSNYVNMAFEIGPYWFAAMLDRIS